MGRDAVGREARSSCPGSPLAGERVELTGETSAGRTVCPVDAHYHFLRC